MKVCSALVAALLIVAIGVSSAQAQATRYWDDNGTAPGAADGAGIADGIWSAAELQWNDQADGGDGGGLGTITGWTNGDHAVFAAGNDLGSDLSVAGAIVTVDTAAPQQAASVTVQEGAVGLRVGVVDTPLVVVESGARLDIDSILRFSTTPGIVRLNGGTITESNPGNAGSFFRVTQTIEVNGIGYIGYDDGDGTPDNKVSIFSGVFTGTGGTTTNGGAGTLVKIGPDQIGIGVSNQGGQHSQSLFTFAKLRVDQGAYRLRHQTLDNTVRETAFGAVPLTELADAITLNGGGIGSNTSVTLHANRGITVTANDGYLDHGATAGLNIPGPLTAAAADHVLNIGSPTSTATNNVTFTLSHANNVNTFQGSINVRRGVLQLNSSLNAANFSGTGMNATTTGTVNVAAGETFTFGSGGANTTYDGIVAGAGTFRKVGAGTTTFNGTNANTHSGDTVIEGGTLSITTPYLANAGDVYLNTGSFFDLSFAATDDIDQLFIDNAGQATGTWGAIGSGAANETALITGTGLLNVLTGANIGLDGDYNGDGSVDAADYVVWRKDPASHGGDPQGYEVWRANFGATSPPGGGSSLGSAAVPEPAALTLLVLGVAAALFGRRGR